jgi:hypothetical protein|nr:MAG TPA: hypothetical protein [Caudoviricetes sp.]
MQITIDKIAVSEYVQSYSETIEKVYDTANSFIASDGTEHKKCKGSRKKISLSLGNVPVRVKNLLKVKSSLPQVIADIAGNSVACTLDDFSAVSIIQAGELDLWTVGLTISPTDISSEGADTVCDFSVTHLAAEYSLANGYLSDDIRISVNAGGAPTSGVCAAQLTFKINTAKVGFRPYIDACGVCTVKGVNAPKFYVSGRSFENNTYTVTATDRTLFLDAPFDYTALTDIVTSDKTVATASIVSEIARQCGFKSSSTGSLLDCMPIADLTSTCRNILDSISAIECGIFICTIDEDLNFIKFGSYASTLMLAPDKHTDVRVGADIGPIAGVQLTNNSTSTDSADVYSQGRVGDSLQSILITSKYSTEQRASDLYEAIKGKIFTAFTIDHSIVSDYVPLCTQVQFTDSEDTFIAGEATTILSTTGIYATFSASVNVETVWDYDGALTRQVNAQIAAGRKYHGVSITTKDGFVCEGTAGKITMSDGTVVFYSNSSAVVNEGG